MYGTSGWNAAVLLLLFLLYAALSWWLETHGFAGALGSVILVGAVAVLAIAALLYYGHRQATITRSLDAQTVRANAERQAVDQLQEALLQQNLPAVANLRFSATYSPATVGSNVGGDWYDAFELPHGRIMFCIGDVSGHGIEAAATMTRARHAVIAAALRDSDPASILHHTNDALLLRNAKFTTAICGYVNTATLEVRYATAGHPPAILIDADGEATLLRYGGLPLGVEPNGGYSTFDFTAKPNSMLLLYTDGLIEYSRDLIEGERRMLKIACDTMRECAEDPAEAIRQAIFSHYKASDDVAILTISFRDTAASIDHSSDWSVGLHGARTPFDAVEQVRRPAES